MEMRRRSGRNNFRIWKKSLVRRKFRLLLSCCLLSLINRKLNSKRMRWSNTLPAKSKLSK